MEKSLILQEIETNHLYSILDKVRLSEDGTKESQNLVLEKELQSHVHQSMHTETKESEELSHQNQPCYLMWNSSPLNEKLIKETNPNFR